MAVLKSCFCIISLLALTGCATITRSTTQQVPISSSPSGASVTINNLSYGETPIIAQLDRKNLYQVTIQLEGYPKFETTIIREMDSKAILGNCLLIGGIPGIIIDSITGAGYVLKPEKIHVQFLEDGRRPQLFIQSLTPHRKQSSGSPAGLFLTLVSGAIIMVLLFSSI